MRVLGIEGMKRSRWLKNETLPGAGEASGPSEKGLLVNCPELALGD